MHEITAYQLARLALLIDPDIRIKSATARAKVLERAYQLWEEAATFLDNVKIPKNK